MDAFAKREERERDSDDEAKPLLGSGAEQEIGLESVDLCTHGWQYPWMGGHRPGPQGLSSTAGACRHLILAEIARRLTLLRRNWLSGAALTRTARSHYCALCGLELGMQ